MSRLIYIEQRVIDHPLARAICARYPRATLVPCEHYREIFNRKAQNFRLQKQRPALILAHKHRNHVLPAPPGYGVGGTRHFYFSHMLNCVYDCRYCFLQGMHRSAHHVIFVNFEDYLTAIHDTIEQAPEEENWFFSGYDCDSLAYEPITRFAERCIPFFRQHPDAWLELRTKSTQVRTLLNMPPLDNVVVAFSFTPQEIATKLEHGVPTVAQRLQAMHRLQRHGWRIGLRIDPLIYHHGYRESYRSLFDTLFAVIAPDSLHSVSLGAFRMPRAFFDTLVKLYPEERLFAGPLQQQGSGMVGYEPQLERELRSFCEGELLRHIPQHRYFPCHDEDGAMT